ncbi:Eukaryotic translation initiation factor 2C, partial [Gamsiella multidivaricata]
MMQHQRAGQGASVPISLTPNARRPDNGGRSGKAIQVRTNFFAINKLEVDTIWHYDVSFTPTIPAEKARRLWKLIEDFPELAKHKVVFDGRCNAYASQELTVERLTRKVELPEDGVSAPAPAPARASSSSAPARAASSSSAPASGAGARKKNEITVKINRVARIDLEELHRFLRRQGPVTPGCFTAIQGVLSDHLVLSIKLCLASHLLTLSAISLNLALNVVMSHKLFSEMVNVGRSAYTPNNASDLGGGIEKWDGVFQSVRPGQNGLYANIDIASTAFIKGGNAASLMAEVQNVRNIADLRNLHRRQFVDLQRHFKGCSFTVNHRGGAHKRKYKVSQVSMMPADKVFFEQETNGGAKKKVSIPEYYTAAYKLKLQYPFLPCLGVKGRDGPLYFPAEICNIVPGRRYQKKLNEEQTAAMIRTTCIKPDQRAVKIKNLLPLLDFDRNRYLKGFQMEISKEMTTVPARVLAPPDVMYRGGVSVRPSYGSWQLNPSRKMVQGSTLSSWGVLIYEREDRLRRDAVQHFIRELNATLVENGMDVRQRAPPVMYAAAGSLEKNVESMIARIQEQFKAPPQLILVVMPSKCQTYSAIKTYCETVHRIGVMTQCALSRNVLRANKQYCGNIGLKINAKLGGMNNNLKGTAIPFLSQKPTMIIGADVTHPAPGETKPSIVAVVASMDEHAF